MHLECWTTETRMHPDNFGCIQNVKLHRVHPEFLTSETRVHTLKVKSHKPGCTCIKIMKFTYFFHIFCFASFYALSRNPTWGPNRNAHWYQKSQYPNFYDTHHTFMNLCCIVLTCFTQDACSRISKRLLKLILLSDWSGLLCTVQSISGRTSSRLYDY